MSQFNDIVFLVCPLFWQIQVKFGKCIVSHPNLKLLKWSAEVSIDALFPFLFIIDFTIMKKMLPFDKFLDARSIFSNNLKRKLVKLKQNYCEFWTITESFDEIQATIWRVFCHSYGIIQISSIMNMKGMHMVWSGTFSKKKKSKYLSLADLIWDNRLGQVNFESLLENQIEIKYLWNLLCRSKVQMQLQKTLTPISRPCMSCNDPHGVWWLNKI